MTQAVQIAIHEVRTDNRLYSIERSGRIVKKFWHQLDDLERASIIQAETRAYYEQLFNIYDF